MIGIALALVSLPACSTNSPSAPVLRAISGPIVLRGYLVDADGRFQGTRIVSDADGVKIELARGNRVVATTTTVDGVYRFSGLGTGAYVARTVTIGGVADTTEVLTVANSNVTVADTLRMDSRGDLYPAPNPFVQSTTVYFEVPDTTFADVTIRDLAGVLVRTLSSGPLAPGLQEVAWDGRNEEGNVAPAPIHWVVYVSEEDLRAQLLFR